MNNLTHLQASFSVIAPSDNNTREELPNAMDGLLLTDDTFSLSKYEDDDEDSGFCCPCCLPR